MKNIKAIFLLTAASLMFLTLTGCATSAYYFPPANEQNSAAIYFEPSDQNHSLRVISFNGQRLPRSGIGKRWQPVHFPAGTEIGIMVHARFQESTRTVTGFGAVGAVLNTVQEVRAATRNVDIQVMFNCPPLEAGKNYRLLYHKELGIPGRNFLILIDLFTGQEVHRQEFIVIFGSEIKR